MASFREWFAQLQGVERGWVNDPVDAGGETWCGITRRDHPEWRGWPFIDATKSQLGIGPTVIKSAALDRALAEDPQLPYMAATLYKQLYWDPLKLDDEPDKLSAFQLADTAVVQGMAMAKKEQAIG